QEDGAPMFLIDPQRCPKLCEAFRARYRRAKNGAPDRTERPHIDLMNALEYYLVNTKTGVARRGQPAPDLSHINEVSGYGPWGQLGTVVGVATPQQIDAAGATSGWR